MTRLRYAESRSRHRRASVVLLAALLGSPLGRGLSAQDGDTLSLAEAARAALDSHPSVEMARQAVVAARASASEARAARLPSVALQGSVIRFQEPMVVAPFHGLDLSDPPPFDPTLVRGGATLAYTLFDGGARSGRIGRAEAVGRSTEAELAEARMDLLHRVVEAYLSVLTAREVLEAHRRRLEALEAEHDRARRFFEEGAAPRVELLRAQASLSQARAEARAAQTRLGVARRELVRVTGLPQETVDPARLQPVAPPEPPGGDAPADSTLSPPEVRSAEARVAAAERTRDVARAAWLPSFEAAAGFNEYGSGQGDFTGEWQAALQVSYPVFTGGARSAAGERADAELGRAREALALTRLETRSRSDLARSALEDALARTEALEAGVRQFEEVARIEALALEAGSGVQRDLLAAQASLLGARAQLAEARNSASLAAASLARVRGELSLDWIAGHLAAATEEISR